MAEIKLIKCMWVKITKFPWICWYSNKKLNISNLTDSSTRIDFPKHFKVFIDWIFWQDIVEKWKQEDIENTLFNCNWKSKKELNDYIINIWEPEIECELL